MNNQQLNPHREDALRLASKVIVIEMTESMIVPPYHKVHVFHDEPENRQTRPDMVPLTTRDEAEGTRDMLSRMMSVRAATINEADRSVEAVMSTPNPVAVMDWNRYEVIDECLIADGGDYPRQMPMLECHARYSLDNVLGSVRDIRRDGENWVGRMYFAKDNARADVAWDLVRQGHVTDVSIGYRSTKFTDIPAGQSGTVNGKTYTASAERGLRVTTAYTAKECSLVPIGADPKAKVRGEGVSPPAQRTAPAGPGKGDSMNPLLRSYLETLGLRADATEADAQAFAKMLGVTQRSIADDITGGKIKTEAELKARTAPPAAPVVAAPIVPAARTEPNPAPAAPAAPAVDPVRAERERQNTIRQLAGREFPPEMLQRALDDGWTVERASTAILEHVRGRRDPAVHADGGGGGIAPAGIVANHERDCNIRTLGLAMAMRAGVTELNVQAHFKRQGIAVDWQNVAQQAHRYADMSMLDVCREGLRLAGLECPHTRQDTIRAAVGTAAVADIFTTSVNATLMQQWLLTEDTTVGWVNEVEVNDFKTQDRIDFQDATGLTKLPRGQEAAHATASDVIESYKIARYAKQFCVDEQDVIDDRFDILIQMPQRMGIMGRQLRPELIYSILLANAKLSDGVALFDNSTHKNYDAAGTDVAGGALSANTLQAGITAMAKQTIGTGKSRKTLNIKARYLIVPQDLFFTASVLLRSAQRIISAASGGTFNPLQDLNINLVSDNRLGVAGTVDPVTGTVYTGTAVNWFLMTDAGLGRTIECAYLRGFGRAPRIRSYVMSEGRYGLGWDISLDIGAKALDYRGMYSAKGSA